MRRKSKAATRMALIITAAWIELGTAGCGLMHAKGDAERVERAERIRCRDWDGHQRGFLLGATATAEVKQVLKEAITPLGGVIPTSKGGVLGGLVLEGTEGDTLVQVFFNPRWVELEQRYYKLTEAELDAIKHAVESPGQDKRQTGHELVP